MTTAIDVDSDNRLTTCIFWSTRTICSHSRQCVDPSSRSDRKRCLSLNAAHVQSLAITRAAVNLHVHASLHMCFSSSERPRQRLCGPVCRALPAGPVFWPLRYIACRPVFFDNIAFIIVESCHCIFLLMDFAVKVTKSVAAPSKSLHLFEFREVVCCSFYQLICLFDWTCGNTCWIVQWNTNVNKINMSLAPYKPYSGATLGRFRPFF